MKEGSAVSSSIHRLALAAVVPVLGLVLLTGCMPGEISMRAAKGESAGGATLTLVTNGDHYELHRWHQETDTGDPVIVPRAAVPGCRAVRFFLDDAGSELRIAEPVTPPFVTVERLPLPGPGFPDCALRVTYGRITVPGLAEGLFVAGPGGLVAESRLAPANSAYYALAPFEAVGEVWLFSAAALATPVLLPGAVGWKHADDAKARKARAQVEAGLPPPVAACWRAADAAARAEGPANPGRRFIAFAWPATGAGAHVAAAGTPAFADAPPPGADGQVTLRLGRARIAERLFWTDAEFDCALAGDTVVASRFRLVP